MSVVRKHIADHWENFNILQLASLSALCAKAILEVILSADTCVPEGVLVFHKCDDP